MKEKSLTLNAIFNVLYKILNVIFPLISATYISRVLMATGVGKISYAQNIVSYFTMFAALGIPIYGTREIARVRDKREITNQIFTELFIINFISTLFSVTAFILLIMSIPRFQDELILYLVCGLLIFFNFINVDWFYQGKEEYVYIAIRSSIIKLLSLFLLFIFVRNSGDYIIYALISSLAIGGNYVFNIINLRKHVRFDVSTLSLKKHLKPIFILVVCSIATELYGKVDITMLGIKSTEAVVGYYANTQKMINLVITFTTAISSVFLPRLSYYYLHEPESYNKLLSKGLKIVLFFTLPCFLGIFIVSNNLIPVMFGNTFIPAVKTTKILSFLILIKSLGDLLCYQIIISSGQEKRLFKSYAIAALVNIILNYLLIPSMNQNGAAIASVISELLVNVSLLFTSLKIVRVEIELRYLITTLFSTIIMALGVWIIGIIFDSYFLSLFLQTIVGILIYFLLNFIFKSEILNIFIKNKRE